MNTQQAKNLVIDAGKELVRTGLIARTWGNVSCRINDKSFVITPSGKAYDSLTPDDIVEVAIDTLEYGGEVKPSSEKGIHAEVYKLHEDANFVIHTHQDFASVVSVLDKGISPLTGEAAKVIGNEVLIASYGLPGTGKLCKGVSEALASSSSKAIIMARHGALCYGKDSDEAFAVANMLEKVCEDYVLDKQAKVMGARSRSYGDFCLDYAKKYSKSENVGEIVNAVVYNSICYRDKGEVVFSAPNCSDVVMRLSDGSLIGEGLLPAFSEYHRNIYLVNRKVHFIVHNNTPEVAAASALVESKRPLTDDFAQIVGSKILVASSAEDCKRAIKNVNAAFIKDYGALCCGKNKGDTHAVDMIMSKACKALFAAKLFGNEEPIGRFDAHLMRFVYLKKYSKKAE